MPDLDVGRDGSIHYVFHAPKDGRQTFTFLNSMGATSASWETRICPLLRQLGYGTMSLDYRGQGQSRFAESSTLKPDEILSDIGAVVREVAPQRPILVGLSVGGMFAMRAHLQGVAAEGIVLINTLRKPNALIAWIMELESRLLSLGGMPLVMDVFRPSLCSPEELARLRPNRLQPGPYQPWPHDNPRHRMASAVSLADWDIPYEELRAPVLVLSGLHDNLFRVAEDVQELMARIPEASEVQFADAGHALHEEMTDRFVEVIAGFADRLRWGRQQATPVDRQPA
jgi:3-oxoadipate enol-lactonase